MASDRRPRPIFIAVALCAVVAATAIVISAVSHSRAHPTRYQHADLKLAGDVYQYLVYVPASYRPASPTPLIVVLHGCRTTADQQAAASNYTRFAELHRFIVLYPDVDAADLANGGCWKGIWDPEGDGRGRGDAGAIAAMTAAVMRRWRVDASRVYAIGISAGAFESSILGATYPDLYAAIGVHSGAAYRGGSLGCLTGGESPASTTALARAALVAMGPHARVMPVIVFHGDRDQVIPYRCGEQALRQWLETDDLLLKRIDRPVVPVKPAAVRVGAVTGGRKYTVTSYLDQQGCTLAQLWTIHGMGHAWSGGSSDASIARYTDPGGPSAAAASLGFFLRWRRSGPASPCAAQRR